MAVTAADQDLRHGGDVVVLGEAEEQLDVISGAQRVGGLRREATGRLQGGPGDERRAGVEEGEGVPSPPGVGPQGRAAWLAVLVHRQVPAGHDADVGRRVVELVPQLHLALELVRLPQVVAVAEGHKAGR